MSGPKKSSWQIQREREEARRKERALERQRQVDEIKNRISNCINELNNLKNKYPELIKNVERNINEWIKETQNSLSGDLRDSFRKIRGIENYLSEQKDNLKDKQRVLEAKRIIEEKKRMITNSLDDLKNDYKNIMNDGIIQRIEAFKKSININVENKNTFKQIEDFKKQLFKMEEEYLEKQENTKYVADKFSEILGANINKSDDNFTIKGDIEGVPITVKLNTKNNNIDFDTPVNGSCKKAMETIQKKLSDCNINLGEIKVVNTGELLNKNKQRVKKAQRLRV